MKISPKELHALLLSETEHTLVDVREIDPFSQNHLLFAIPLPLGRLELLIADLIPRKSVPIVICDETNAEGLAERAARRLHELGFNDVAILDGGITAWREAGFETYSGVNVPSKAFGEFIEHEEATPSLSAEEVQNLMADGSDILILDSRPFSEFNWASIPTGLCCSGAELVYRAFSTVPSPETKVIVNCAGRTRSIIGAQSLINAGLPNKVYALRNGIMGWRLSGYEPATGAKGWAPTPEKVDQLAAHNAAVQVAERFNVQPISLQALSQWQQERDDKSLFVLDVRTIDEFEVGHLADAVHAPGGQVIQATDEYIGVRNARIVLVDNDGTRATMTASWLLQMGHSHVRTLAMEDNPELTTVVGPRHKPIVRPENLEVATIDPRSAKALVDDGALILDMSLSPKYREGHIPGAWFVLRSQIKASVTSIAQNATSEFERAPALILTSEEGSLAKLGLSELSTLAGKPVHALEGGNTAWQNAGFQLTNSEQKYSVDPIDIWRNKDKGETVEDAMRAYLDWEVDLMVQLGRDGSTRFQHFPKSHPLQNPSL
ncbi:MAG: thiosulfate sulfurtransferase [Pseudomonadales bacterium]|nr:thiosulfate sulfurtransferase [Pseudomonadales bacterium]